MSYENIQNDRNVVDFVLGKWNHYNPTLTVDAPAQIVTRKEPVIEEKGVWTLELTENPTAYICICKCFLEKKNKNFTNIIRGLQENPKLNKIWYDPNKEPVDSAVL